MFELEDKGVLYFAGEGSQALIMRSRYIDNPAARVIVAAGAGDARGGRADHGYAFRRGRRSGAGVFAADVLTVLSDDEKLWCEI